MRRSFCAFSVALLATLAIAFVSRFVALLSTPLFACAFLLVEPHMSLGLLGWLMLVTLPGGAIAFAVWLVILIIHRNAWHKRGATS